MIRWLCMERRTLQISRAAVNGFPGRKTHSAPGQLRFILKLHIADATCNPQQAVAMSRTAVLRQGKAYLPSPGHAINCGKAGRLPLNITISRHHDPFLAAIRLVEDPYENMVLPAGAVAAWETDLTMHVAGSALHARCCS